MPLIITSLAVSTTCAIPVSIVIELYNLPILIALLILLLGSLANPYVPLIRPILTSKSSNILSLVLASAIPSLVFSPTSFIAAV